MKHICMRLAFGVLFAGIGLLGSAEAYPDKPIRLIVPNAAGGGTDTKARLIAQPLEAALGQPVTVMNVAGAGTSIGARQTKDAEPDGHTVMFIHQAPLTASAMGVADFGPEAFEIVAQSGSEYYALMVNSSSPLEDMKQLIEKAKAEPDTLRFGVQIGAINHFSALDLASETGSHFRLVNTGSGGTTRTALLGNHIDLAFVTIGEASNFLDTGELKLLAVLSPERLPAAPDVPTAREQGFDVIKQLTYWWWMPKGVPADRVAIFVEALQKAMEDPRVVENYKQTDVSLDFASGPQVQKTVEAEFAGFQELAKTAGLK